MSRRQTYQRFDKRWPHSRLLLRWGIDWTVWVESLVYWFIVFVVSILALIHLPELVEEVVYQLGRY
jgi:hypothetical protein